MDRGSSATDSQTEMDCVWVTVGLDAEVGFVMSQGEHLQCLGGAFWTFTILGCGSFSQLFRLGDITVPKH